MGKPPSKDAQAGRAWAAKVFAEKMLVPERLPNLGHGYSDAHRAAHAVRSIADRKLYVQRGHGCYARIELSLPRRDKEFWHAVVDWAGEMIVAVSNVE